MNLSRVGRAQLGRLGPVPGGWPVLSLELQAMKQYVTCGDGSPRGPKLPSPPPETWRIVELGEGGPGSKGVLEPLLEPPVGQIQCGWVQGQHAGPWGAGRGRHFVYPLLI